MKKLLLMLGIAVVSAGTAIAQNNISGTFETWRNYNVMGKALEAPAGWYGGDSIASALALFFSATPQKQVSKSSSSHGGTYAAQIVTKNYGGGTLDTVPGILLSGKMNVDISSFDVSYTNLPTVNQRIPSLSAWVKYAPIGDDEGYIEIAMYKTGVVDINGQDSAIGEGYLTVPAMANYGKLTVPIDYFDATTVPDKILVTFYSSGAGSEDRVGSTMYVDDVVLNLSSGLVQPMFGKQIVKCFPNPSKGQVFLNTDAKAPLTWSAYNVEGRVVATQTFTGTSVVNMDAQPAGVYSYRVTDESGNFVESGNLTLQK